MHRRTNLLTILIVLGLIAGVVIGEWMFRAGIVIDATHWSKTAGDLVLIRPLKLLIVPIVFVSVLVGVTSIGNPTKLGVVGGSTILYYMATMLIAVVIGTTLVSVIQPGDISEADRAVLIEQGNINLQNNANVRDMAATSTQTQQGLGSVFAGLIDQAIPTNVVKDMSEDNTLRVIVFALLLGLALAAGGEKTAPAVRFFEALFDAIMRLVMVVVWVTPLGVMFLMIYSVGGVGLRTLLGPIVWYVITVLLGLALHGFIVLPLVLAIFARTNPYRFMYQMRKALMTAFGTDSSSATLPVTIQTAETEGGCSKRASNFVLPLGSTINMDGTALYEAVAVVFLFQLYGIPLEFDQLLVVVVTATLVAIGAAGVPSAGVFMMFIVVIAVNKSLAGTGKQLDLAAIGVIIGIDRIIDMCRTTVNVWGDAVGAKIISRIAPDDPEPITPIVKAGS
ncbi:MAG: dicarboxylate/amino acid:cation symporter [Phycisphaerales bacterium]